MLRLSYVYKLLLICGGLVSALAGGASGELYPARARQVRRTPHRVSRHAGLELDHLHDGDWLHWQSPLPSLADSASGGHETAAQPIAPAVAPVLSVIAIRYAGPAPVRARSAVRGASRPRSPPPVF